MNRIRFGLANVLTLALGWQGAVVCGADGPPSYTLQYLGPGSVVALNNVGTVVGFQTSATTGLPTPLVSVGGGGWSVLPIPAGASGAFPTDLNDAGEVVGVASMSGGRRAVRWLPAAGGYWVELLPLLPGEVTSYATGINNHGQIVGARAGVVGLPFGFGWLYSDAEGLVDLNARYGWFATPGDINDTALILSGTEVFDLATVTVIDVGASAPAGYNAVQGVAINNSGWIVGSASLSSISLNVVAVFRYVPDTGWQYLSGSSKYTVANDINDRGDVGWGESGAGLYLEGLGKYALFSLLEPAVAAAGWTITGNGCLVNDQRLVATVGRNTITGQSGAVLLTPAGVLPPPAAPTGLTATPHPSTTSEPYLSIDLSWKNGDPQLTQSYQLERSLAGQSTWTSVPLVPPAMSTFHQDTTVMPGITYDYRVRAVGVAGPGPWSAVATATAPSSVPETQMRVSKVTLSGKVRGNKASIAGVVQVVDASGRAVVGATVSVRWTLPGGATASGSGVTDDAGTARFAVTGPRGTYTLTVIGVSKAGHVFDAAGSVLSGSITR